MALRHAAFSQKLGGSCGNKLRIKNNNNADIAISADVNAALQTTALSAIFV